MKRSFSSGGALLIWHNFVLVDASSGWGSVMPSPELNMSMCENFHFLTRGIPI